MVSLDAVAFVTKLMIHFLHKVRPEEGRVPYQSQGIPPPNSAPGRQFRGASAAHWRTRTAAHGEQQPPGPQNCRRAVVGEQQDLWDP